jgi:hypothetical protein
MRALIQRLRDRIAYERESYRMSKEFLERVLAE